MNTDREWLLNHDNKSLLRKMHERINYESPLITLEDLSFIEDSHVLKYLIVYYAHQAYNLRLGIIEKLLEKD